MQIPRKHTLSEVLYKDLLNNSYLVEIYQNLLMNYSIKLFGINTPIIEINIDDALRFADLLSKSNDASRYEEHRLLGQEIAILLNLIYPNNIKIKYYLGSILSSLGNYRGLKANVLDGFKSIDLLDSIYYEYDMENHLIPGKENEYFFHDQKDVYDNLETQYFSYSGPTSMGKSFVVQTYIEEQIKSGSIKNYAILVPTKALINEVKSNIITNLKNMMVNRDYRVVSAAGDIVLNQKHHFVFVMTPERLLYLLINYPNIKIDFLFIDEAHKISDRGGRSAYYYKVVAQIINSNRNTKIIFASPNIPNPEIYFDIIPDIKNKTIKKIVSKYSPVCQFKYYLDLENQHYYVYDSYSKQQIPLEYKSSDRRLIDVVKTIGANSQNLVYCASKRKVLELAIEYAKTLPNINNPKLITLSNDVKSDVHEQCYLADLILKGVAYHVGYLPANIRLRIEKSFEDGDLKTIFCTSTLIEGINLPADNLFISSYKNGLSNMNEVEFKNLIGRVGRIKYNLYGNVFLVRDDHKLSSAKYINLLQQDIPNQSLPISNKSNKKLVKNIVKDLSEGDLELSNARKMAKAEKDYSAARNFSMILTRDIALDSNTPLRQSFIKNGGLNKELEFKIKNKFPVDKTSDDITLSYDQIRNLRKAIADGLSYPKITNGLIEFDEVVHFMKKLRRIFKWEIYEPNSLGRIGKNSSDGVLKWYSLLLMRWIQGYGLNRIIHYSLKFKNNNPESGVWMGFSKLADYYDGSKSHQNYVISETLSDIENILLYSISNYFRQFSIEYKKYYNIDRFDNDWYDFVEYGTTNPLTMFLQQAGFSRQVSIYIKDNRNKYLLESEEGILIKKTLLECGNIGVETEANDIQFNMPELFVD